MNTKMKVLSLALVGLCGFAGSAMAACPAGPDTAHGGAWNSVFQIGGTATIVTPGLASTECKLASVINAGAGSSSTGSVAWASASGVEPSYRAQFIIEAANIASPALADAASIYSAASGAGGNGVRFSIFGSGGVRTLGYQVRYDDATDPSGKRYRTGSVPLPDGEVHIEYSLKVASASGATDGAFSLWVQNNVEGTPTKTETALPNFGLTGIDSATLGLAGAAPLFVTHFGGQAVNFDQYDSRRQTFIGY